MQNGSERAILKNVSAWLGTVTLARDIPIRHKNLSFKDLLIEGFDSNRLIVAIPFVCKTLEGSAKSRVFLPPNPWLMAVVSLLAELYHFADLKLNMKFEIEMLCKTLGIDLDTVEVATILRNRPLTDSLAGLQMPDYVPDMDSLPIASYDAQAGAPEDDGQVIALGQPGDADSQRPVGTHIEAILSNLMQRITVNPQLSPYNTSPPFKRAVQIAVDRAIRDVRYYYVDKMLRLMSWL